MNLAAEIGKYLRPSSASNWMRCFGYARLNASLGAPFEDDEGDVEVREDGTACHWLSYELACGTIHPEGTISPNGRYVDDAMISAAEWYVELLRSIAPLENWSLEKQIPVSKAVGGISDGTPDAWTFDGRKLTVVDLKYGFRYVDAWRNWQLLIYAITVVLIVLGLKFEDVEVELVIFQPRAPSHDGGVRSWKVSTGELYKLHADLVAGAWRATQPDALCTPHPGCENCPAAHACEALRVAANSATQVARAAVPAVMDNNRLAYELSIRHEALKVLEAQITGLETQAEFELRHGKRLPGYELSPKRTLWRWREGAAEMLAALGPSFKIETVEQKPKSVARLRGSLPAELIDMLAEKPNGGLKLKAIDPNEAQKRFGKL